MYETEIAYKRTIYDLGIEPVWVPEQVKFIEAACKDYGIPFYILRSNLYQDYMKNFESNRVSAMPFWTINEDGKEGCIQRRACTVDYKIVMIPKFVWYQLLGYRPYQHLRPEDVGTHELHIGFSKEESQRSFPSRNRMFKNCYPLIEMGWERKDCYQYNLEEWGLDSKASACLICPYHKNYFFHYIQRNYPDDYASVVDFDGVSGIPQLSLETVGLLLVLVSAIFSAPLHKNRAHRLVSIRSDAVLPIQL